MYGELIPAGGGDPIPLLKKQITIGRRESCDIVLRFSNVSAHHCQMSIEEGYWFVKDLNSRNGVKVNGVKLQGELRKRLDPGDTLVVAKHTYKISYSPTELGAVGTPPQDDRPENVFTQSLMERAGLTRKHKDKSGRFDVHDDRAGQLKHRSKTDPV